MKAVEWLAQEMDYLIPSDKELLILQIVNKAKEIEKQQQNEFAIEFAEWCRENYIKHTILGDVKNYKELLEIFKKEKGL